MLTLQVRHWCGGSVSNGGHILASYASPTDPDITPDKQTSVLLGLNFGVRPFKMPPSWLSKVSPLKFDSRLPLI